MVLEVENIIIFARGRARVVHLTMSPFLLEHGGIVGGGGSGDGRESED